MRITKYIPDTITSLNLLCGVLGVIFTLDGRPDIGFLLMIGAAVADFFDGFAARLLHAYSDLGKQLDSLSDLVSFGVLPALMLYVLMRDSNGFSCSWVSFLPLIYAVGTAFRLAKFNIDERQHMSFIGLPCPAAAMICGSFAYLATVNPFGIAASLASLAWFPPVLASVLALLMVSEVPMFAMKFGGSHSDADASATLENIKRIAFFSITAIVAVVTIVLSQNWSLVPLLSFTSYILITLLFSIKDRF